MNNKGFLFYLFANQDFVDLAYKGASGTRMPRADWNFMSETEWLIPKNKNEQKAIALVLSSLDDKIDLLHRQNKTLEAMAETLFRQWFVEEAQEDWEEKPLSFYGNIVCGKTPSKKKKEYFNGFFKLLTVYQKKGKIPKAIKHYLLNQYV
jgi:type I restriction enzyme S subunit